MLDAVAIFGQVRLRHHPEQPVAVDALLTDDAAAGFLAREGAEDGLDDPFDRTPAELVADRVVAVAACVAVVRGELLVGRLEMPDLLALRTDMVGRFADAAFGVVADVGEERDSLLAGERVGCARGDRELVVHGDQTPCCRKPCQPDGITRDGENVTEPSS